MKRAIFGLTLAAVLAPLLFCGLVCRTLARSRIAQAVTVLAIIAACSGCSVATYAIERDSRQCQAKAVTVAAMVECQKQYPQHGGTVSDKIAQPVGELERHIFGLNLEQ